MSERITMKIDGMTCGGCESSVKAALERLDGVQVLDASFEDGTVELLFEPERVARPDLANAVEEAGYEVVSA